MILFVTKKRLKYWRSSWYINGYAQGTTDTRNEAKKAGVYTWSGHSWHNKKTTKETE